MSPRARENKGIVESVQNGPQVALPGFLKRGADGFSGRVAGDVSRPDIPFIVDETAIAEFYAR